jgi:hypothetical protein
VLIDGKPDKLIDGRKSGQPALFRSGLAYTERTFV